MSTKRSLESPNLSSKKPRVSLTSRRPQLTSDRILSVKNDVESANSYVLTKSTPRNILFCGRTRCGKSTAIEVIKSPCYQPPEQKLFSETIDATLDVFTTHDKEDHDKRYTFSIIDTPGLYEDVPLGETREARDNRIIEDVISKCLTYNITHLHTIVMFVNVQMGINPYDVEAIKQFADMFGKSVRTVLCISRCEAYDDKWKSNKVKEIMSHKEISPLIKKYNMKILFSGCVDSISTPYYDEATLTQHYENVLNMRNDLMSYIFESDQRVQLDDMDLVNKRKQRLKQYLEESKKLYNIILESKDARNEKNTLEQLNIRKEELVRNKVLINPTELGNILDDVSNLSRQIGDNNLLDTAVYDMISLTGFNDEINSITDGKKTNIKNEDNFNTTTTTTNNIPINTPISNNNDTTNNEEDVREHIYESLEDAFNKIKNTRCNINTNNLMILPITAYDDSLATLEDNSCINFDITTKGVLYNKTTKYIAMVFSGGTIKVEPKYANDIKATKHQQKKNNTHVIYKFHNNNA